MISSPLPIILQLAEHSSTESCTGIGSMSLSFLIKKIPCSPVSGLLLITNHISAISKSLGKINILCVLGPCSQSFLFLKSQFINDKEMHSNSFVDNRNKFLQYKDKILYGIFTFLYRTDGQEAHSCSHILILRMATLINENGQYYERDIRYHILREDVGTMSWLV